MQRVSPEFPNAESPTNLWDAHEIEQVYLRYAAAMDSHHWDLFDQCFWEEAEIVLGPLGQAASSHNTPSVDVRTWKQMCREIDVTFDAKRPN